MGFAPIFVRVAEIGPNAIGFYRMLCAAPLLWVWMLFEKRANPASIVAPTRRDYLHLIIAGFFFSADLGIWHFSLSLTTVINATLFNNCTPFFVPLIAWVVFSEKPTLVFLIAVVIAIVGSIILTGESVSLSTDHLLGNLLALASAMFFSGYIIFVKHLRIKFNAPTLLFWTGSACAFFLAIYSVILGEDYIPDTWNDVIAILGLVFIVHIFGQGLLSYSMGKVSASLVSIVLLISPAVAAVVAWIVFGEAMGPLEILGAVIILTSIIVARKSERSADAKVERQYGN